MREFKPEYTEKFRDEQIKWFEERMGKLPQSMQINEFTSTQDLPRTVRSLIEVVRENKPSVTHAGYLETLLQIKDQLTAQGID